VKRAVLIVVALVVVAGGGLVAWGTLSEAGDLEQRAVVPAVGTDSVVENPRTYAMGFSVLPPVPGVEAAIDFVPRVKEVGEYTIIQREVPWRRLRAGDSIDKVLDEEWDDYVEFITEAHGLKLVILVDPLDGLNRRRESPEAIAAGATLMDPGDRATHEAFVLEVARRYQPEYLGLASEINTLAAHGDPALYAVLRDMINGLIPDIRAVSPDSKIFVSHQVDDAWGLFGESQVPDQFKIVHDFEDTDVVGLSSYPVFFWDQPEDVPDDYYQRYADESGKPLIQVEGGWSSERTAFMGPTRQASLEVQTRYFIRLFELLDGVEAELVVLLTMADLDLSRPEWGLSEETRAGLSNFARMGILDTGLRPKPAHAVWVDAFERPLVER
jgi:hypothetical protein